MPLPPQFVQSAKKKFGAPQKPQFGGAARGPARAPGRPAPKKFGAPGAPPKNPPGQIGQPGQQQDPNQPDPTDPTQGGDNSQTEQLAQQIGAAIDAGQIDQVLAKLMAYYDPEHGVPSWAPQTDLWDQAEEAVDPEGHGRKLYDDPWLVVAHVYKALGGKVDTSRDRDMNGLPDDEDQDQGGDEQDYGDEG